MNTEWVYWVISVAIYLLGMAAVYLFLRYNEADLTNPGTKTLLYAWPVAVPTFLIACAVAYFVIGRIVELGDILEQKGKQKRGG